MKLFKLEINSKHNSKKIKTLNISLCYLIEMNKTIKSTTKNVMNTWFAITIFEIVFDITS